MRSVVYGVLFATICLSTSVPVSAQTVTGTLDGQITDQAGALVPDVRVSAKDIQTGLERATKSNEAGYFQLPFLPLGVYEVKVEMQGFATVMAKDIEVTLNEKTKSAEVLIPDDQLSLAIGRDGQNVRLAAKLTGWKIDIKGKGPSAGSGQAPSADSTSSPQAGSGQEMPAAETSDKRQETSEEKPVAEEAGRPEEPKVEPEKKAEEVPADSKQE